MTVTPRGVSVGAGVKGARVNVNNRGRVTGTVGIPGSGVSYSRSTTVGGSRGSGAAGSRPAPQTPVASSAPTPGLFAPKWEKALVKLGRSDAPTARELQDAAQLGTEAAFVAAVFDVLRVAVPGGDLQRATDVLNWLHQHGYDPSTDPFLRRYFPAISVTLVVVPGVRASMPVDRDALALLLAELEQSAGHLDRAIQIIEDIEPTTIAAVSLAELYAEQGRWDEVVRLTDGVSNEDDLSLFLLTQRGIALREQRYFDAAREAFKEALRIRSRSEELRQVASIERGKTYLAEGKKGMARKDFERVLAQNSEYEGLQDFLDAAHP